MRVAQLAATLLALPALCLAQEDNPTSFFAELAASNGGIIKLNTKLFHELTAKDRNWSATIELTALGASFKCMPCKEFEPVFKAAGKAWSKVPSQHRNQHFFGSIDFEHGQDVFRELGLQTAPVVLSYTPTNGPRAPARPRTEPITYDFNNNGFGVEELIDELSRLTPVPIPYTKPLPWALIFTALGLVLAAVVIAPYVLPVLLSRWTWAAVTIYVILIMVGGQMYVVIRKSPSFYPARGGGYNFIVAGFQNQLGAEVYIVAAAYGLLSFTVVALNSLVTRVPSPTRQRTGVLLWTMVMMIGFSGLLALFRVKNPSYPFKILF